MRDDDGGYLWDSNDRHVILQSCTNILICLKCTYAERYWREAAISG